MSLEEKRQLVCPSHKKMSVHKQCKIIGLPRSSYYFKPKGVLQVSEKFAIGKYTKH